jgi:hypothetical protein
MLSAHSDELHFGLEKALSSTALALKNRGLTLLASFWLIDVN